LPLATGGIWAILVHQKGDLILPLFDFDSYNLLGTLVVSLSIQALFFVMASWLRSDVFTDITYSMTFAVLTLGLLLGGDRLTPGNILQTGLIVIWSARLGGYLLIRILRTKKDDRFNGIRENPLRFGMFWFFQGVSVWVILLPTTLAMSRAGDWLWCPSAVAGCAVWLCGFVLETVADQQKFSFRSLPENRGRFIQTGLWRTARHPNYFGEMLCWWGLFFIAAPAFASWQWVALAGPVFLTALLRFGTGVPTVARKQKQKYGHLPEYQRYLRSTNLLVPWWPRRPD
jgi:steroid 5-alpha reductase family enzyme